MVNQLGTKRYAFASIRRAAFWGVSLSVGMLVHCSSSLADESSSAPAWMSGTPTWTGDGYRSPAPVSSESSLSVTSSNGPRLNPYVTNSGVPYTVPSDPHAAPASTNFSDQVALASASTPLPGIDSSSNVVNAATDPSAGTFGDTISQVAHQQGISSPVLNTAPLFDPPGSASIAQRIGTGISMERPPLMAETLSWYQYPWRWMSEGWTNSFELGLDGSKGNAETLAIQTGAELKRKTDAYTLALDFDYRLANNRDVVTEENGRFNVDYDRLMGDSPWSLFGKFGMEWDEFKAFDLRLNLNGGVGYHWLRDDRTTFVTRFGAGASREIGSPDDDWVPEAVFGMDLEHQVNKRNKLKAKVDYFPSWEDFSNYRLVTDASWEILLSEDDSLSLKLAATDRYDSTPQGGNKANDVYYSLLLLVKF